MRQIISTHTNASTLNSQRARTCLALAASFLALAAAAPVFADPCGMVPPIYIDRTQQEEVPLITRVGEQKTYVFHKDGVETFVIRPGFSGKAHEFGMLIPFPEPPSIRKVADDVFSHIAAAIDPPEVTVRVPWPGKEVADQGGGFGGGFGVGGFGGGGFGGGGLGFRDVVNVVREEAVGMYDVAVLEAGSADALSRWMTSHNYRYPEGMDDVCEDYIDDGWCFVAVRTRVGQKKGVDPRPGQRGLNEALPAGATFDGHVQAMGFRFRSKSLVVPMRLSTYNEGNLLNVVYVLTEGPRYIRDVPKGFVKRQVPGQILYRNVIDPLPLRVLDGPVDRVTNKQRKALFSKRNPTPHNGIARDLFAADLMATLSGSLTLDHEEEEKELLRIGERFDMRGPEVDKLHANTLARQRRETNRNALAALKEMTLTVIDGDYPREVLARDNLKFARYRMARHRNKKHHYDAKTRAKSGRRGDGILVRGELPVQTAMNIRDGKPKKQRAPTAALATIAGLALVFAIRRRGVRQTVALLLVGTLFVGTLSTPAHAGHGQTATSQDVQFLLRQLRDHDQAEAIVDRLVEKGEAALEPLFRYALRERNLSARGWAIVAISEIGSFDDHRRASDKILVRIANAPDQPSLVRVWATAARINETATASAIVDMVTDSTTSPAVHPILRKRVRKEIRENGLMIPVEQAVELTDSMPKLNDVLDPMIRRHAVSDLVPVMLGAAKDEVRRKVAGYVAAIPIEQHDNATRLVAQYCHFDEAADQLPWENGALFLPQLDYMTPEAQAIVDAMIEWHVWCGHRQLAAEQTKIDTALTAGTLLRNGGYHFPKRDRRGNYLWLDVYSRVHGKKAVRKLEQRQRKLASIQER